MLRVGPVLRELARCWCRFFSETWLEAEGRSGFERLG